MSEARVVYLAGPIHGQDDSCLEWRRKASKVLRSKNILTLDPTVRDYRGKELENIDRIIVGDKRAIMMADTILCYSPVPSYGTAMELYFAWSLQKQIITVSDSESPWLHYHSSIVLPDLDSALNCLQLKP